MKRTKAIVTAIVSVVALTLGVQTIQAQDFGAFVNLLSITTNHDGMLVSHRVKNRDFIRACAREKGVTNLMGLSLVYNRTADDLEVRQGTNLTALCKPLTFSGGTWLMNSNRTRAERLTFVFVETNKVAGGSFAATERFHFGPSNELTFFALSGELQYTTPASGTNPPVIYKGRLSAGMPHGDSDEDHEDHEDHED